MKPLEIAFVCYAVSDFAKAQDFYQNTLGLKPGMVWKSDSFGFQEYDLGGNHTLAIGFGAEHFKPGKGGCSAALEVEDFDAAIKDLKAKGVKFEMEAMDTPICHMAIIHDLDGNQIMIHKRHAK